MIDIASLQTLLDPLFPGLMGVTLKTLDPERVVAEMEVRPDLCTAGGILHGGAAPAARSSPTSSPWRRRAGTGASASRPAPSRGSSPRIACTRRSASSAADRSATTATTRTASS